MSITYKTKEGDSFNIVARKTLGNDTAASLIKDANPGVSEPLPVGTLLQVPGDDDKDPQFDPVGLHILVNDIKIGTFNDFLISKAIDAIRKCSFTVPNEQTTRDIFIPLIPMKIEIGYNGIKIFTGWTNSPVPDGNFLNISAYSKCAIIEDSPAPLSSFPQDFPNSTLGGIVKYITNIMGIGFEFKEDSGARFTKTNLEQDEMVLSYFSRLAVQRGFVIADNANGDLVFQKGDQSGDYILILDDETQANTDINVTFDESQFYATVTGYTKTKTGKEGKSFTVKNPAMEGVIKPYSFEVNEAEEGELETVVNTVAGRMFASVLTVSATIPTWLDLNAEIIENNKIVSLRSPKNYISDYHPFIIKNVSQSESSDSEVTTLELTFAGAYSGEIPESLPW